MKKLSFLIILFFATTMAYGHYFIPAKIVDKDGYVNVRKSASSNSAVVTTISSGTKVYYIDSESPGPNGYISGNRGSNWYRVSMSSGGNVVGYVHSSRLKNTWTMVAGIVDTDGPYTNIRKAPGGEVALKLSTKKTYVLLLSDCKNGWWHIESIIRSYSFDDVDSPYNTEEAIAVPKSGYWIHSSCLGVDINGDGHTTFSLYAEPKNGSKVIKTYSNAGMGINSILDLSADKKYLKVKLSDGRVGWMLVEKTCWSAHAICGC